MTSLADIPAAPASAWFDEAVAVLRRVAVNPMGLISLVLIVALALCALFAPWIAPYDPIAIAPRLRLQGPGLEHWLGTDQLGRDLLSRLIFGTATALRVALLGTGGALLVGMILGIVAGIGPRAVDSFLILICDALKSLPMILFALAIVTIYGPNLGTLIVIIVFSMARAISVSSATRCWCCARPISSPRRAPWAPPRSASR